MKWRALFIFGAALCVIGALAGVGASKYAEAFCIATNASGEHVVIGTRLTEAGQRYKRENPGDDNNAILQALAGRGPEAAWTAESIARCRLMLSISPSVPLPMFLLSGAFGLAAFFVGPSRRRRSNTVFLSYNHSDADTAGKLHRLLKANRLPVLIDSEAMQPGERIQDFIGRCIRDSDAVVSLVSTRSLLSAWVAMETVQALAGRKLIACYLDDAFLAPDFRLRCTEQIDERLRFIEAMIPDYAARRLDTVDLNEEKTRLYDLRNNLGVILATLKDSLCLDVREERFDESAKRLVAAVRGRG